MPAHVYIATPCTISSIYFKALSYPFKISLPPLLYSPLFAALFSQAFLSLFARKVGYSRGSLQRTCGIYLYYLEVVITPILERI